MNEVNVKKEEQLTEGTMMKMLEWTYEKTMNGLPGTSSAYELMNDYERKHDNVNRAANALIRNQNMKAGASGFLTGVGGFITLPVAVPANVASVLYVQMRMIAAVALLGGHDLKDDQVKTLVYVALLGNAANEVLKQTGIKVGEKITRSLIQKIPGKALTALNQKVGFRLVTKFGQKGAINLGKGVPLIGGFIGGALDVTSTNLVGKKAKEFFLQ